MITTGIRIPVADFGKCSRPEVDCGTVEAFNEQLDGLYWKGYARELAYSHPAHYAAELQSFINQ